MSIVKRGGVWEIVVVASSYIDIENNLTNLCVLSVSIVKKGGVWEKVVIASSYIDLENRLTNLCVLSVSIVKKEAFGKESS